jgi:hypothetical protein
MWKTVEATGAMETFAVSMPPAPWNDNTCAAWTFGGTGGAYVGFGTQLAGGNAYDLSKWSGMTLLVEGQNAMWLQLKTMAGAVYQVNIAGAAGTSMPYSIKFSDMMLAPGTNGSLDLTKITDVQLMAATPSGFGYALHSIVLNQ